jgi:hypothetical protein
VSDFQRAFVKWLRPHEVILIFEQDPEVFEGRRGVGVFGAERFLIDR